MKALLLATWALAASVGWRHDGTGVYPATTPPTGWSATSGVAWSLPLPARSNASPVVTGGKVCVAAEPGTVLCADAATGRLAWQATVTPVDAMDAAQSAAIRPRLAKVPELQKRLLALQGRYAEARRSARAGGDVLAELESLVAEMGTVQKELDALAAYTPPGDRDEIGWTSPTPVSDGTRLYVSFGSGVVAAFTLDGQRLWSRWLGVHTADLRGYRGHPTASPVLAGGTLVVGYNTLLGLDPATGRTRWERAPFEDFGAPAVVDVGGLVCVVTPSGRLVRASDGALLREGLGDLWYSGPLVQGTTVFFVGTTADMPRGGWPTHAVAWDLARSGDTVVATKRFATQLPIRDRFYATPVPFRGKLYTVSIEGTVLELDPRTGATLRQQRTPPPGSSKVWASLAVAGDRLRLYTTSGHVLTLDDALVAKDPLHVEAGLAPPTWSGGRLYLRGATRLWAVGR